MTTYICKYVLPTKNGHSLPSLTPEQYKSSTVEPPFNDFDIYDLNWCKANLPDLNYSQYESDMANSKLDLANFVNSIDNEYGFVEVAEFCEVNNYNEISNYFWVITIDNPLTESDLNTLTQKWEHIGGKTSDPRFAVTNPDHDTHCMAEVTVNTDNEFVAPNSFIYLRSIS